MALIRNVLIMAFVIGQVCAALKVNRTPFGRTRSLTDDGILNGLELLCQSIGFVRETQNGSGEEKPTSGDKTEKESYPTTCLEALKRGQTTSGVITVKPDSNGDPVEVYCDQQTDGGGWIVFQRRQDGRTDFFRGWQDYKEGFGSLTGEFWLGHKKIRRFLSGKEYVLRVDLGAFDNTKAYAKYSKFMIGSENENYVLTVDGYSGTAGDSMIYHNGKPFTTRDRDNDRTPFNCAYPARGAWWYDWCYASNLNGLYNSNSDKGVVWREWKGLGHSLKSTEMKLREK